MCHIGDIAEISFCGGETVVFAEKDQFSISVFTGMAQVPVFSEFEIIKNRQCCIIADRHISADKIDCRFFCITGDFRVVGVSGIAGNKEIAFHCKCLAFGNGDVYTGQRFGSFHISIAEYDQFHAVGVLPLAIAVPPIDGDIVADRDISLRQMNR